MMAGPEASAISPMELWRLPRVLEATGLSRTTMWRLMEAGTFPSPFACTAPFWPGAPGRFWLGMNPGPGSASRKPHDRPL
jgi:hypothetical protein